MNYLCQWRRNVITRTLYWVCYLCFVGKYVETLRQLVRQHTSEQLVQHSSLRIRTLNGEMWKIIFSEVRGLWWPWHPWWRNRVISACFSGSQTNNRRNVFCNWSTREGHLFPVLSYKLFRLSFSFALINFSGYLSFTSTANNLFFRSQENDLQVRRKITGKVPEVSLTEGFVSVWFWQLWLRDALLLRFAVV